jgi:hypothetical protein
MRRRSHSLRLWSNSRDLDPSDVNMDLIRLAPLRRYPANRIDAGWCGCPYSLRRHRRQVLLRSHLTGLRNW